jgi:hypothetical protein
VRIRDVVFDASAIVAVFDVKSVAYGYWKLADDDDSDVNVAFPVGAMLDAARAVGIRASAWDGVLWSPSVRVLALSEVVAKDIGDRAGSLGARHALWEAQQLGWPIVTAEPDAYPAGTPVLPI